MDLRRLKFIGMTYSRLRNIFYLARKGRFKNAYSYLWSSVLTRDSGVALLDPLWRLFPLFTPYPEAIEIEPTTRCHLKCLICEHTYWSEPSRDLSFSDFKRIVNQFPHLKWIGLTGIGSSFLNPDYLKMLEYVKKKGVYVEFFDTFDLVTEDISRKLVDLAVDKIWLSCEAATQETYEKIRVGGNFGRMLKNVRTFLRLKKEKKALLPELWFHYIINKHNLEEMADYVDFVAELMKDIPQSAVLIFYTGLMEFKEVLDLKVAKVPDKIREEVYRRAYKKRIYINWNENIDRNQPPSKCTKWTEPFILSSGHIQPCCVINEANEREFQKENAFMNLLDDEFSHFWHSERFKKFVLTLHEDRFPKVCKNCKVYRVNR
ncbi:MAG: radical SAM protein [Candidatus Omnitrophica bacterium]|nr:radical SAM protein [Candidatus Omnitrophota bacterium]